MELAKDETIIPRDVLGILISGTRGLIIARVAGCKLPEGGESTQDLLEALDMGMFALTGEVRR